MTITRAEIARLALARELQCVSAYNAGETGPPVNRAVANVAIVNGSVTQTALPVAKLAAWARLLETRPGHELEIDVEISDDKVKFRANSSFLALKLHPETYPEPRKADVPRAWIGATIRIVAKPDGDGFYKVELADGATTEIKAMRREAASARKGVAQAGAARKAREAGKAALNRLVDAARGIVAARVVMAEGVEAAYCRACDCRDAMRVWRRSIATPETCPDWLPETCTPTSQELEDAERFGTGYMPDLEPRKAHAALVASIAGARAAFAAHKPPMRYQAFVYTSAKRAGMTPAAYAARYYMTAEARFFGKRETRGPKWDRLNAAVDNAVKRLNSWLGTQYQRRLLSIGLPRTLICGPFYIEDVQAYSRARLAIRRWPVAKAELVARYLETREENKSL